LTQEHLPNLVVLDVVLPGMGGIEASRKIKQRHPKNPVLILTSQAQKSLIERLISAGVQGYCLRGIAVETWVLAIRAVAVGASWWVQAATAEIRAVFANPEPVKVGSKSEVLENPLTKREQEILTLVAGGKSNQEIAQILYNAPGTVRVHVHGILQKLEVRDRTQAAVLAIQKGLVAEELLAIEP
jgi:two-component system NarL family response regulator